MGTSGGAAQSGQPPPALSLLPKSICRPQAAPRRQPRGPGEAGATQTQQPPPWWTLLLLPRGQMTVDEG